MKIKGVTFALAVALLHASHAQEEPQMTVQEAPPPARAKPVAQGSLSGKILCSDTRGPARGAHVMVTPEPSSEGVAQVLAGQPHMAITGLDGTFFIPHLAPGEYMVVALAAGYLSPLDGMMQTEGEAPNAEAAKAMEKALRASAPMARISGSEAAHIDIELQRGAVLSGKVLYSDGSPAGQLQVLVEKSDEPKAAAGKGRSMDVGALLRTMLLQQIPSTDDQGHFRISGISPGKYRLAVTQSLEAGQMGEELMGFLNPALAQNAKLTVYSGNTLHRKDAKLYELRAGDSVDGIEITLPLSGLHSVQGIASGKDGALLTTGVLELTDTADPSISFHTRIRAGGEFRFAGVPEGIYELKETHGRIVDQDVPEDVPPDALENNPQWKPLRAFADTTVALAVHTNDIENFILTLADTKLPDPPKFPQPSDVGSGDQIVVAPTPK